MPTINNSTLVVSRRTLEFRRSSYRTLLRSPTPHIWLATLIAFPAKNISYMNSQHTLSNFCLRPNCYPTTVYLHSCSVCTTILTFTTMGNFYYVTQLQYNTVISKGVHTHKSTKLTGSRWITVLRSFILNYIHTQSYFTHSCSKMANIFTRVVCLVTLCHHLFWRHLWWSP